MSNDCQKMFSFVNETRVVEPFRRIAVGLILYWPGGQAFTEKSTVSVALGMRNATFFTGEIRFLSCII